MPCFRFFRLQILKLFQITLDIFFISTREYIPNCFFYLCLCNYSLLMNKIFIILNILKWSIILLWSQLCLVANWVAYIFRYPWKQKSGLLRFFDFFSNWHGLHNRIQLGQPATVKVAANLVRLLSYSNKVCSPFI